MFSAVGKIISRHSRLYLVAEMVVSNYSYELGYDIIITNPCKLVDKSSKYGEITHMH